MKLADLRLKYTQFAPRYDEAFADRQRPKFEQLAARLPSPMPDPALDLGAGTGLAGRILGVDFVMLDASRAMLEFADGRRVQGAFDALPFADDSFAPLASNHRPLILLRVNLFLNVQTKFKMFF